jgi:hypothetical protein
MTIHSHNARAHFCISLSNYWIRGRTDDPQLQQFLMSHHRNMCCSKLGCNINGMQVQDQVRYMLGKEWPWLVTYLPKLFKPWWIKVSEPVTHTKKSFWCCPMLIAFTLWKTLAWQDHMMIHYITREESGYWLDHQHWRFHGWDHLAPGWQDLQSLTYMCTCSVLMLSLPLKNHKCELPKDTFWYAFFSQLYT